MPSPRPPFDQGLFLTHFNKGKDLYDEKRYEDAERELEEAYLLRPRDHKVLNLLGLVYFKQEKFEKAEEVYRKLVAESPEATTLFYNLGLICFKLNRMEEAESAFLKALELAGENPKINFYLGSIYERMHRFQDAIYQYRQAGANILVRRVEDKIAAGAAPHPVPKASKPVQTQPVPGRPKRPDDTAEFKAQELQEALRRKAEAAIGAQKDVGPVSDVLMAEGSPRRTDTTIPSMRTPLPPRGTLPPPRPGPFRFLEENLMEIDFSGKVFIKQGTIYSYSGHLTFWVKEKRPGGSPALVIITGTGKVILTDKDRDVTFMHIEDEPVWVAPTHLLACEDTLTPRYAPLAGGQSEEFLVLEGRGMIALSVGGKPLALSVTPDLPASVPLAHLISWSGELEPKFVDDPKVYEALLAPGAPAAPLLRLEGTGRVLVEQH
jgi:tetratricopeptide (TPR) repeat protein/uncharacterized protein (AIM24 family)